MAYAFASVTLKKKHYSENRNHDAGHYAQPGIKPLRYDVLRCVKRDPPQKIHPGCMRRGDDQSEQQRMLHSAPRANKIRGDQSLAVTGLQGMERAEAHGNRKRDKNDAPS